MSNPREKMETVTLGGGCFWCTEAVFLRLKGVATVRSGYSGGHVKNPAYREVSAGSTGHFEVVQITFDPAVITFRDILEVFFAVHDPTTLNRQGADMGAQNRSAGKAHRPLREDSAQVYRDMWGRFAGWCVDHATSPERISTILPPVRPARVALCSTMRSVRPRLSRSLIKVA